jgi:pilus assembly protein CpaB
MRSVFGLVLVVGMGLAGFAVYMVKGYIGQTQNALNAERQRTAGAIETVDVYAVTRAIAYGESLTMDDVTLIRYAKPHLPEGVFETTEALFPEGEDVVRVVIRPMEANEPVLAVKVTDPGEIAGITSLLAPGMRAFTIKVDVSTGVSGFLRPGDFVDVYWSGSISTDRERSQGVTQLIKAGLELIAVDQTSDGNRNGAEVARTVTVQVSPQDVAALAQAQSSGNLSLSLRGNGDEEVIASNIQVNQNSLLGLIEAPEEIAAAPAPVAEVCKIIQRNGTERVEIIIPCTN